MKNATVDALEEVIEALLNFVCDPRPRAGTQDPALRALVKLRNELPNEREAE